MSQEIVLPLQKIQMSKGKKCMLARMPETFKTARKTEVSKSKDLSFQKRLKPEAPKPVETTPQAGAKDSVKKKVKGNEGQPIVQYEYNIEDREYRHPKTNEPGIFTGEALADDNKYALLVKKKDVVELILLDNMVTFKKIMKLESNKVDAVLEKKRGRVSKRQMFHRSLGIATESKDPNAAAEESDGEEEEKEAKEEKKKTMFVEEEGVSDDSAEPEDEEDEEQKDYDREFAKRKGIELPDDEEKNQAKIVSAPNTTGSKGKKKNLKSDDGGSENRSEASDLSDFKFSDDDN